MTKRAGRRALENFRPRSRLSGWRRALPLVFKLLAQFIGPVLQVFLQFLLLFFEHFGVGGRTFIGLLEAVARVVGERQGEADRGSREIDRLDHQHLALLELADKFGRRLVIGHATVGEASEERTADRRLLVDDDAGAVLQLQRARQSYAEQFLRLALRLDQCRRHDWLTSLGASILAGEADLFGTWVLAFAAEFSPP